MLSYADMSEMLIEPIQPQIDYDDASLETLAATLLALVDLETHMPVIRF